MKSLTAHGTEQIGPRELEQESSGQGGRSGVGCEDDSPRENPIPPAEVESSSSLGAVVGELPSGLLLRVDDRVEMRVGPPGSSSELEAELIAQTVSLSGEKLQSLMVRRCRVEVLPVRDPRAAEEVEGWSRHDKMIVRLSQGSIRMASVLRVRRGGMLTDCSSPMFIQ